MLVLNTLTVKNSRSARERERERVLIFDSWLWQVSIKVEMGEDVFIGLKKKDSSGKQDDILRKSNNILD